MNIRKSTRIMIAAEWISLVSVFKRFEEEFFNGVTTLDGLAHEYPTAFSIKKNHNRCVHSRNEAKEQRGAMLPAAHRALLTGYLNRLGRHCSPAIGTVGLVLVALAAPMAHGQTPRDEENVVSIAELKRDYLLCNQAAISGRLNSAAIPQCSILYEELKRRAFGGDFYELLAWSQAYPSASEPKAER